MFSLTGFKDCPTRTMFTKQDLIKSAILIWIVGSAVYIVFDTWNDYKIRGVQQAYQAGVNDTTKQIFEKSQALQCKEALVVTSGENKMELVDVKCLQQPGSPTEGQPQAAEQQAQPATPKK